jgi:Fe-S-cluster containining protein
MGSGFNADEEEMFYQTGEALLKRLRRTRNPADLLATVRLAYEEFDRAYASAPAEAQAAVACRSGCAACCHERVGVQAHEVLIAANHIQRHFTPAELDDVIARAAAHRVALAERDRPGWQPPRSPCVLLRAGACSIYESRPEACRSHHSHDAAACQTNLEQGNEAIDVKIPGLRGRMYAVMLGLDHAVEEAGFDDRAYDFGTALYEALTDSRCAIRWTQRQPAFPASCLETLEWPDADSKARYIQPAP